VAAREDAMRAWKKLRRFGNAIKRFEANGPDPNTLKRVTVDGSDISDMFLLRRPGWRCYFLRDPVDKTGTGVLLCKDTDVPASVLAALAGAPIHGSSPVSQK
jgi:hypothetical protein